MKPKAVVELAAAAPAIVVEEILAAPEPPIAQALEPPEPEIVQELQRAAAVEDVVVPVLAKHFDIDLPPRRTLAEREKPAMRYASDEDVKEFAQNISRVKGNQRNTLEAVMEHGLEEGTKRLGLQPSSVTGYLSMAARIMGIPKPNRFHPYDRLDALRRAWAYFKLNPEACGSPEKVILRRGEWKLLESFRVMSSEDKMQFLKMAEVFASKSK